MTDVHAWVRRMWAGEAGPLGAAARFALWPAEGLFRAGGRLRREAYDRGWLPAEPGAIPVVSVGNLSVGGTGKTPVSSWIIRQLDARGEQPALGARGEGRDELLLHRTWTPSVPVIADPDRRQGVREAASLGATVAVLDDGFQHRRLARQADVVLVATEEGLPGALLPRGPFREPRAALGRAQGIVVTRKSGTVGEAEGLAESLGRAFPAAVVATVHLAPGAWRRLAGTGAAMPGRPAGPVTFATGVARPESVRASVEAAGCEVRLLEAFPDHHEFTEDDLERILDRSGGRAVVVTEKDAVKLAELPLPPEAPVWVLGQELWWTADPRPLVERVLERIGVGR